MTTELTPSADEDRSSGGEKAKWAVLCPRLLCALCLMGICNAERLVGEGEEGQWGPNSIFLPCGPVNAVTQPRLWGYVRSVSKV